MKAWLVTANDSFLWFPTQDDAEGFAQTLIADLAQRDSSFMTIDKYSSTGSTFESLAGILNGHCKARRVFLWKRQEGKTILYSRADKEIRVSAFKPNHPTAAHAAAVQAVLDDPALLELVARANNHTEWVLYTSNAEAVERRLATYIWFYIKAKRLGSP